VSQAFFPIPAPHQAGHVFIAGGVLATLLLLAFCWVWAPLALMATLFCIYFFRDPIRMVPTDAGVMVAPADGRVLAIGPAIPPVEWGMGETPRQRITIFLSVFDVHVNRIAAAGTILKKIYHEGKFLHAAKDKASEDNERLVLVVELPDGAGNYAQLQIAGLIARRILCDVSEGDRVATGARYGIIRFGSRMDIYLPETVMPLVTVGQTMIGGETILAQCSGPQHQREGLPQ
jgi:phosphatidylserine decarboxylase